MSSINLPSETVNTAKHLLKNGIILSALERTKENLRICKPFMTNFPGIRWPKIEFVGISQRKVELTPTTSSKSANTKGNLTQERPKMSYRNSIRRMYIDPFYVRYI